MQQPRSCFSSGPSEVVATSQASTTSHSTIRHPVHAPNRQTMWCHVMGAFCTATGP